MKISFAEYARKVDVSVLVAQAVFNQLSNEYPLLTIADVADTTSGGTPSRSNASYYDGDIPWMKSGELNDGLITEIEETITEEGLKNSSAKIYPKETLVIALYGATAGKVGILGLDAASNQAVCAVFPNAKVDRDYMFWFLRQYRYNFIEISKGGAQPNISQGVINKTRLPVPPIDFQKSIAAFLKKTEVDGKLNFELIPKKYIPKVQQLFSIKNTYETLRSELTHQQTLLTRLRQSILQEAVQGQLTAQWRQANPHQEPASELLRCIREEKEKLIKAKKLRRSNEIQTTISNRDQIKIPATWEWVKGDEIFFVTKLAGFEYTEYIKLKDEGEVPVIRAQNVRPINIDKSNLKFIDLDISKVLERSALTKSCLLVTFIGAGIGDVALFNENIRWHLAPNVAKMEFFEGCNKFLDLKYFNYFLMSQSGQSEIFKHLKATAQPSLSMGTLRDIDFALPPLPEQTAIVAQVERLLGLVGQLEAEAAGQRVQAEGLLQAALREAMGA